MTLGDSVLIVARPEDARQAEEVVRTLEKTTRAQAFGENDG